MGKLVDIYVRGNFPYEYIELVIRNFIVEFWACFNRLYIYI